MIKEQPSAAEEVALRERVKELSRLYGIARIVARHDLSLEEILQCIVDQLPPRHGSIPKSPLPGFSWTSSHIRVPVSGVVPTGSIRLLSWRAGLEELSRCAILRKTPNWIKALF